MSSVHLRDDPLYEAARQSQAWRAFHDTCRGHGLFFDDDRWSMFPPPVRYEAVCYEMVPSPGAMCFEHRDREYHELSKARGKTPQAARVAAYRASGRISPPLDAAVETFLRPPVAASVFHDDEEDLIG